jgi:hypothetical protein
MKQFTVDGYRLVQTCDAYPEQYDVFNFWGDQVGYLRFRHGCFTATVPDVEGTEVYCAFPKGDGTFYPHERLQFLKAALHAITEYWANN